MNRRAPHLVVGGSAGRSVGQRLRLRRMARGSSAVTRRALSRPTAHHAHGEQMYTPAVVPSSLSRATGRVRPQHPQVASSAGGPIVGGVVVMAKPLVAMR